MKVTVIAKHTEDYDDFLILQDENDKYYIISCDIHTYLGDLPVPDLTKEQYIKYLELC